MTNIKENYNIDANLINYARLMTCCQNWTVWPEIWYEDGIGYVLDEYKRKLYNIDTNLINYARCCQNLPE